MTRRIPRLARWQPPSEVPYDTSGAIAPTNRLFAWDTFESYANTAAFQAACDYPGNDPACKYWQAENIALAEIDTTYLMAGHQTLKTKMNAGSPSTFQPAAVFRNTLNGGTGGVGAGEFYDNLWGRLRAGFVPGFTLGANGPAGASYKWFGLGWIGGTGTGHGGRSTIELDGYPNVTMKMGLHAPALSQAGSEPPPLAKVFSCIGTGAGEDFFTGCTVAHDQSIGSVGTLMTDGLLRDLIWHVYYPSSRVYRLRWWRAVLGQVPTKVIDLTGPVKVPPAHENDPVVDGIHDFHFVGNPRVGRINPGLNFNRAPDADQYARIGSWECANGLLWANPFDLPAAQLA